MHYLFNIINIITTCYFTTLLLLFGTFPDLKSKKKKNQRRIFEKQNEIHIINKPLLSYELI